MPKGFFSNPAFVPKQDPDLELAGEIRVFVGDGTPVLKIDPVREVRYVRVGNQKLRREWAHVFPVTNGNPPLLETEVHSDWDVDRLPSGETVLLRHNMSNFGIWQESVEVSVGGDWGEPEQKTERKSEDTAPSLKVSEFKSASK